MIVASVRGDLTQHGINVGLSRALEWHKKYEVRHSDFYTAVLDRNPKLLAKRARKDAKAMEDA